MHPLRYTLYKILDGKKLRALSFHGRSQTMNILANIHEFT